MFSCIFSFLFHLLLRKVFILLNFLYSIGCDTTCCYFFFLYLFVFFFCSIVYIFVSQANRITITIAGASAGFCPLKNISPFFIFCFIVQTTYILLYLLYVHSLEFYKDIPGPIGTALLLFIFFFNQTQLKEKKIIINREKKNKYMYNFHELYNIFIFHICQVLFFFRNNHANNKIEND